MKPRHSGSRAHTLNRCTILRPSQSRGLWAASFSEPLLLCNCTLASAISAFVLWPKWVPYLNWDRLEHSQKILISKENKSSSWHRLSTTWHELALPHGLWLPVCLAWWVSWCHSGGNSCQDTPSPRDYHHEWSCLLEKPDSQNLYKSKANFSYLGTRFSGRSPVGSPSSSFY